MDNEKILVTQPFLPPLDEFIPYLEKIWDAKWLTNNGPFHQKLEEELSDFLGVKHICLCANGTLALMLALKALDIKGEVITTPFSFVATSHSIIWNNSTPVFCDIEENTLNIDPDKIEELITEKTTAILPVHVYGHPCNNDKIQIIADKYNLKVIYDAAHAFNVKKDNQSILNWGDLSVLSFHATKVFNTFEGGAIVCKNEDTKKRIDSLKNFGFVEGNVVAPGINAKMNEVQAAFGLLHLKYVFEIHNKRKLITDYYRENLKNIEGISFLNDIKNVNHNYSYFPFLVDKIRYGMERDELYKKLMENGIYGRRYFYPLISNISTYSSLPSASKDNLLVANKIADEVICLPIYPDLSRKDQESIVNIIKKYSR